MRYFTLFNLPRRQVIYRLFSQVTINISKWFATFAWSIIYSNWSTHVFRYYIHFNFFQIFNCVEKLWHFNNIRKYKPVGIYLFFHDKPRDLNVYIYFMWGISVLTRLPLLGGGRKSRYIILYYKDFVVLWTLLVDGAALH